MEITIISPLGKELEVWTLHMTEEEMGEFLKKYGHRGSSVLVSPNEIAEEINDTWNMK